MSTNDNEQVNGEITLPADEDKDGLKVVEKVEYTYSTVKNDFFSPLF